MWYVGIDNLDVFLYIYERSSKVGRYSGVIDLFDTVHLQFLVITLLVDDTLKGDR